MNHSACSSRSTLSRFGERGSRPRAGRARAMAAEGWADRRGLPHFPPPPTASRRAPPSPQNGRGILPQHFRGEPLLLVGEDQEVHREIAPDEAEIGGEVALQRGPPVRAQIGARESIA